jgi:hypothetical protein
MNELLGNDTLFLILLYPQEKAEIMAGRIPIDEHKAEIPENLDKTVIGTILAGEIHW